MNTKRSRSNAKANIWDIQITSEEMIRFILVASHIKNNNTKFEFDFNGRRNAYGHIWKILPRKS